MWRLRHGSTTWCSGIVVAACFCTVIRLESLASGKNVAANITNKEWWRRGITPNSHRKIKHRRGDWNISERASLSTHDQLQATVEAEGTHFRRAVVCCVSPRGTPSQLSGRVRWLLARAGREPEGVSPIQGYGCLWFTTQSSVCTASAESCSSPSETARTSPPRQHSVSRDPDHKSVGPDRPGIPERNLDCP